MDSAGVGTVRDDDHAVADVFGEVLTYGFVGDNNGTSFQGIVANQLAKPDRARGSSVLGDLPDEKGCSRFLRRAA